MILLKLGVLRNRPIAEYVAASKCTRKVVYLRQLLSELGYPQGALTHIYEDNQTCISFTRDNATLTHKTHRCEISLYLISNK
jgi:hypothetical protein